jgi:hypothetical protein
MLEKITVFGFVGKDERTGEPCVEVDLWKDIVNDYVPIIELARDQGAEVVFMPDGDRRG